MEDKLPAETAIEPEAEELTDSDLDQVSGGTHRGRAARRGSSSDAQLDMVNMQSLMSQRQQAEQMASAMLKSTNDTTSAIIKNIG